MDNYPSTIRGLSRNVIVRAREGLLEDVMHSSRAALYSPLQLWGTLRRELISSPLKNCTIIHCLGTLTGKWV